MRSISEVVATKTGRARDFGEQLKALAQEALDLASETSQQLREFIHVIDERYSTWEAFCAHLQRWGHEIVEGLGLAFQVDVSPSLLTLPPPPVQLRVGLYLVYREAIINAVKHTHAESIQISLVRHGDSVVCEIQDNGVRFDPAQQHPGHYGLQNIRKHVREIAGDVTITATLAWGRTSNAGFHCAKNTAVG